MSPRWIINRRDMSGPGGPNNPNFGHQPDERQFASIRGGMVDFREVIAYLDSKNVPPQLRQTPYIIKLTAKNTPFLLIPTNPNRMSFLVAYNGANSILMSYNSPSNIVNALGILINSGGSFSEGNGTVSIDDIYVYTTNDADVGSFVLGYEGTLAIESHLHQNTSGL